MVNGLCSTTPRIPCFFRRGAATRPTPWRGPGRHRLQHPQEHRPPAVAGASPMSASSAATCSSCPPIFRPAQRDPVTIDPQARPGQRGHPAASSTSTAASTASVPAIAIREVAGGKLTTTGSAPTSTAALTRRGYENFVGKHPGVKGVAPQGDRHRREPDPGNAERMGRGQLGHSRPAPQPGHRVQGG